MAEPGTRSQETESAPRGQEGALPSPCTRKDVLTYPCAVSRLVVGCRHMLWELAVLCQCLLIPPIARQAGGGRGLAGAQEGPSSETHWIQHIVHAKEPRPVAHTNLLHQSRDAQSPLAPLGHPGAPEAEDTSGDRVEVTLSAWQAETPPFSPQCGFPLPQPCQHSGMLHRERLSQAGQGPGLRAGGARSSPGSILLATIPFALRADLNYEWQKHHFSSPWADGTPGAHGEGKGCFCWQLCPTIRGVTDTS